MTINPAFQRLALITGEEGLARLAASRAVIFGVGGVGSWAAEALVRSGIGTLTIVDSDAVCVTNVNRQIQATVSTVGRSKTDALRDRLLSINPHCEVTSEPRVYDAAGAAHFAPLLSSRPYVIDAIDSLTPKLDLIEHAASAGAPFISCMGMAQKLDPSKIRLSSIWGTQVCPLARLVRGGLRKRHFTADFPVVFSPEVLPRQEIPLSCGTGHCLCAPNCGHEWCSAKKVINGSSVTATAGMFLAAWVTQEILSPKI